MGEEIENVDEAERVDSAIAQERAYSNLPFILTLAALIIYFGFQTLQLLGERSNMTVVKSNQEAAMQEAQKVQAQFKNLVDKTSELADQGHAGAKMVMEELLKRGVSSAPQAMPPETKAPGKLETNPAQ
ncbi:MAG TPA: hypothetical protein VFX54_00500 [Candidatus Binatia bacterium]|nr:hypothetical protein [Candidatus Binatia bacterium]